VAGERVSSMRLGARPWEGWRQDAVWLMPLLMLFVCKQLLLVALIGPFTGHDEVDHYWYVARLGSGDGLGVVGDVNLPTEAEPFRQYVIDYPANAEVIQPPLYHLALAPLWRLVPGDVWNKLYVLRATSVVLGLGVVWLAYLTARLLFPGSILMRVGVPAFVALQPQLSFEAAIVNHDILVVTLFSAVTYLLLGGLRDGFSTRRELAIGLLTAAGLWTKVSFGLILPVTIAAIGWSWLDRRKRWSDRVEAVHWLLGSLFLTVGLPLLTIAPWFVRSFVLYGDPTGAARLREIRDFAETASTYRAMVTSVGFWHGRLEDFWSNFGWRHVPFDPVFNYVLWSIWGIAVVATVALVPREVLSIWRPAWRTLDRFQRRGSTLLALATLALVFGVLYVGTIQFTQSRFAFPAMIGFATLTLLGLDRWLPVAWRQRVLAAAIGLLLLLNGVMAIRFLIPFYYGPGGGAAFQP
jgi:hypothetical protein